MVKPRLLVVLIAVLLIVAGSASAKDVRWISKDELRAQLENPGLTIIDVRIGKDWNASNVMVKGAVREAPQDVSVWVEKYPKDRRLVFY